MLVRIISALVGIPVFLGLTLWGPIPFTVAVVVVAALGLGELLRTYHAQGLRPNPILGVVGIVAAAWPLWRHLSFASSPAYVVQLGVIVLLLALIWEVLTAAITGEIRTGSNVAYGLLCGVYTGLFAGISTLRDATDPTGAAPFATMQAGAARILLAACCVWGTDSLAYFVGKAVGKRKLVPKLSPGKTVAGSIGGLVGALAIGAGVGALLLGSVGFGLATGAVAGVLGQFGDLFKSGLKREVGIKDFGAIMPGHGGVLDRFDSLLFVAPITAMAATLL